MTRRFLVFLVSFFALLTALPVLKAGVPGSGGTFTATGAAPGGDSTVGLNWGNNSGGQTHVSTVKVNGTPTTEFEVSGQDTSSPTVTFHNPPAQGATVEIRGTTANSGQYTPALAW